jgi:hypothetical protein
VSASFSRGTFDGLAKAHSSDYMGRSNLFISTSFRVQRTLFHFSLYITDQIISGIRQGFALSPDDRDLYSIGINKAVEGSLRIEEFRRGVGEGGMTAGESTLIISPSDFPFDDNFYASSVAVGERGDSIIFGVATFGAAPPCIAPNLVGTGRNPGGSLRNPASLTAIDSRGDPGKSELQTIAFEAERFTHGVHALFSSWFSCNRSQHHY